MFQTAPFEKKRKLTASVTWETRENLEPWRYPFGKKLFDRPDDGGVLIELGVVWGDIVPKKGGISPLIRVGGEKTTKNGRMRKKKRGKNPNPIPKGN